MALPFRFPGGLFLLVLLFLFHMGNSLPAVAQDTGSTASAIALGSTNYQNAPVNTILDLYEQLSGKHLIQDSALNTANIYINLKATGLSKEEMLKLIEATLLLNGVSIIPVDDHTVKIITIGTIKNPRAEGVKLYANAADLPTTDQIVSYYMPLDYISPTEAVGIFNNFAPFHPGYGTYTPAPSAQAVILTENVSVIRQLIALKELIDAPPAQVISEWVQLNNADAQDVTDILNKMLSLGANGAPAATPASPGGAVIVPARLGNNEPLSNEHNLISGTAQILPDLRYNRVLVITRPVNLHFLEQMIAELDQSDNSVKPQCRPLNYVVAQNILPALEAALAEGKDELAQVQKDQQAAQTSQTRTAGTPGGGGGTAAPAGGGAGGSSGGSGSVAAITPQLSTPTENDVPTVVTIGKTKLMADNRSNSIIVFGSPDVVARVFAMIDQLDQKPMQVYLATVIGQLTVKEGEEFGIDILQKFQHVGQGGLSTSNINSTAGTTSSANLPEPSSLTSSMGFPLLSGLNLYGAIGSTLDAYVRALETTDRFKIISRPSVYTANNKLAVIASGEQVPVPSSTTAGFTGTTDNQLTTTSSIAYEDVLLQLDIIPLINIKHDVTLQIRQTNNSLGANVDISGNEVPIITTQEINTEITVPDKSTVVIGGLINDSTSRDTSGVPWLSDIPLLGYLFKDTTKSKERDELIIMIQPTVVASDADQIAVDQAETQRTILGHEAIAAATGVTEPPPETVLAPQANVPSTTTTISSAYNSKNGVSTRTTTVTLRPLPGTETPTGPTSIPGSLSSPAPNVSNGQMPKYPTAPVETPPASP